jgi:tetratricopeptide (TPR) repeat protein
MEARSNFMTRIVLTLAGALLVAAILPLAAQQPQASQASSSPVAKQPQAKSQAEMQAVMAVFQAPDPDGRIKAAEALLSKYADTEFKAVALQVAAMSAQEKRDSEKAIVYAERALEADPKNFQAMILLAAEFAQRTREHDLDKEEKLAKAEKYANDALAALKTAPRPRPDITDEQWEGAKKDVASEAHAALGVSALVRKKYDVAVTEFKNSISVAANPDPATKVRLGAALNNAGKHDEAITVLDALMSDAQLNPVIRQFAQQEKLAALKAKEAKK